MAAQDNTRRQNGQPEEFVFTNPTALERNAAVSAIGLLVRRLESEGFISNATINGSFSAKKSKYAQSFRNMLRYEGIREFTISSGQNDQAMQYTTRDLFGRKIFETYFVYDFQKFKEYQSGRLKRLFRHEHLGADAKIRGLFSRFMHENQLYGLKDDHLRPVTPRNGLMWKVGRMPNLEKGVSTSDALS